MQIAHGGVGLFEVVLLFLRWGGGGGKVGGGFVAGEIDCSEGLWFLLLVVGGGYAIEFGLEEGCEVGLDWWWEEGVVRIVWDGGPLHGDEGFGGGALVGRGLRVHI